MHNFEIPYPIRLETQRGALSLSSSGRCVAVRLHDDDIELLDQIVTSVGIPRGALMRWFIVYSIKAMQRQLYNRETEVRP